MVLIDFLVYNINKLNFLSIFFPKIIGYLKIEKDKNFTKYEIYGQKLFYLI